MGVQLPENYRRVADAFTELSIADKEAVIGHLQSAPDAAALDRTVNQIIRNGGPKAELVGRIFQRDVNPAEGKDAPQGAAGGIRSVSNKKLEPRQTKEPGGSGAVGAGHVPAEEPHTSTVNPPVTGHPGRTENQPGAENRREQE